MSFGVTLEIDPEGVPEDATVGIVALRLVNLGGSFVAWRPNLGRQLAMARFEFSTTQAREQFLAKAAQIPGVSICTAATAGSSRTSA